MNNRFYFKQFQKQEAQKEGEKPTIVEIQDSVQFEDVLRTRQYPDGGMILVLKDGHEQVTLQKLKGQGGSGTKEVRQYVQSEILIAPEDGARFRKYTEYSHWDESSICCGDAKIPKTNAEDLGLATEGNDESFVKVNADIEAPAETSNIVTEN